MSLRQKIIKGIVLIIPIVILFFILSTPVLTYTLGTQILLKSRPVDPRDIFRGDYVTLGYEIERLSRDKFEDIKWETGMNLYVLLKNDGELYTVDKVVKEKPKGGIYVKGRLVYTLDAENTINIGLDRYFLPEGTGKKYEDMAQKGDLYVKIKIWGDSAMVEDLESR